MCNLDEERALRCFTSSSRQYLKDQWTEEPGGLLSIGSHRVGHD